MIGNEHFDRMVAAAPVNFDSAKVEWEGYKSILKSKHLDPSAVVAATWCSFGTMNIEALVDSAALTIVHPQGILSSVGKRKMFGGGLKFDEINFSECRGFGEAETTDERGLGKYCIEFMGAGNLLVGRLQWSWRAKRFRDSRREVMAVAAERDRIMGVIRDLVG